MTELYGVLTQGQKVWVADNRYEDPKPWLEAVVVSTRVRGTIAGGPLVEVRIPSVGVTTEVPRYQVFTEEPEGTPPPKLPIPVGSRVQLTGDHPLAGQFGVITMGPLDRYWVRLETEGWVTTAAPEQVVRQGRPDLKRNTVQAVPTGAAMSRAVTLRHANGSTLYGTRYTVQYSPTGAPFIVAPGIYAPEADLMKAGWSVTSRSEVIESYGEGVAVPGPYFTGEGPNQTFEWTGAPKPEPWQEGKMQYPRWLVERVAEAIAAGRAGDWQLPEMQNRNAAEVVLEALNVVPGDEHWTAEIREDKS